ncbi:MAG: hypothetical protein JWP59_4509 [Massilia sp.]|nr:hypothetical protein [Massilia sp.]
MQIGRRPRRRQLSSLSGGRCKNKNKRGDISSPSFAFRRAVPAACRMPVATLAAPGYSSHIATHFQRTTMNILHNVEAVIALVAALAVGVSAVLPGAVADAPVQVREISVATPTQVAVVKVAARRLSAVEKMRSLENERALARAAATPRG